MLKMPFSITRFLALTAGKLSRLFKQGGGTSLPGKIALFFRKEIIEEMADGLNVILISGTNGKTTTTNLISQILLKGDNSANNSVIFNSEGANLLSGIATALLSKNKYSNRAVFEVDEAVLPEATKILNPELIILKNLFRDQLDRYGEIETIIENWQNLLENEISSETKLLANADDPLIVAALENCNVNKENLYFYGFDDDSIGRADPPTIRDIYKCRKCGSNLIYEFHSVAHLGKWSCEKSKTNFCSWKRPKLDFSTTKVELQGLNGVWLNINNSKLTEIELQTPLPGLHNAYNATAAISAATILEIEPIHIVNALSNASRNFGRFEEIEIENKKLILMLAKNPTSVNENLRVILNSDNTDSKELHILAVLNNNIADGRDTSWIWDVDYELIIKNIKSVTTSGTKAAEMALRFQYGGLEKTQISVENNLSEAFYSSFENLKTTDSLIVLLTYTALLDFRKLLHKQKLVQPYWK